MDIKINSYANNFKAKLPQYLTNTMPSALQEEAKNGKTMTSKQISLKGIRAKKLAEYSAAMATAALAGVSINFNNLQTHVEEDYTIYLAQKIEDLKLNDEIKTIIMKYLKKSPLFVDFFINNKDKNGSRKRSRTNIDKMYQAYTKNVELTEQLANTFDKEGQFVYSTEQIFKMVDIHENCPDLYEITKNSPDTAYALYSLKDDNGNPRFGIQDIQLLTKYADKFPQHMHYLLSEKDFYNKLRFNGEQILVILNELQGESPDFVTDLVKFKNKIKKPAFNYYKETKISADNIVDIIELNKKQDVQNIVYKLLDIAKEQHYSGDEVVQYTKALTNSEHPLKEETLEYIFDNFENFIYRFTPEQMSIIVEELQGKDSDLVKKLIDLKRTYIFKNKTCFEPILSNESIVKIIEHNKKHDIKSTIYKIIDKAKESHISLYYLDDYIELLAKPNIKMFQSLDKYIYRRNDFYKILAAIGRKLTKSDFEEIKNMKYQYQDLCGRRQEAFVFSYDELYKIEQLVEKN